MPTNANVHMSVNKRVTGIVFFTVIAEVVNCIAFQIILKYLENVYCKLDFSTITFHNLGHDAFLKHDQFHYVLHTV